jgi:hypothetical protein
MSRLHSGRYVVAKYLDAAIRENISVKQSSSDVRLDTERGRVLSPSSPASDVDCLYCRSPRVRDHPPPALSQTANGGVPIFSQSVQIRRDISLFVSINVISLFNFSRIFVE